MTTVGVTGATGQMGQAVLNAAGDRDDVDVVFTSTRDPDGENVDGAPLVATDEFADALSEHQPDAVVDFTVPAATTAYADACVEAGVALVTGTTGLDADDRDALDAASKRVPVLHATNFSRGIAALRGAVVEALDTVSGYDVELTETHHNRKRDAPSGTANTLLDDIESALDGADEAEDRSNASDSDDGDDSDDATADNNDRRVHGREGEQPRESGEIGVHARRAGDVRGEHEVLLAGNDEVLTFTHRAESRGVFAAGALDAASAIAGREPGRYKFADVLGNDS